MLADRIQPHQRTAVRAGSFRAGIATQVDAISFEGIANFSGTDGNGHFGWTYPFTPGYVKSLDNPEFPNSRLLQILNRTGTPSSRPAVNPNFGTYGFLNVAFCFRSHFLDTGRPCLVVTTGQMGNLTLSH